MRLLLRILQLSGVAACVAGTFWLLFRHPAGQKTREGREVVTVANLNVSMSPRGLANGAALGEFERQNPDIAIRKWTKFRIPGDLDIASELMAFAARSAPDVTFTYVHRLRFYANQGFYRRLNEFIGEDTDGNGVLDPEEVRWKPWLEIPPMFRQLGMEGTDIYALPQGDFFSVMVYNPEILRAAGVRSEDMRDFPGFFRAGQKIRALSLRNPHGAKIYALPRDLNGLFLLLFLSGGGTPGICEISGPDGRLLETALPEDAIGERVRDLGYKPSQVSLKWRAAFDGEPARRALEAIWKICWQPWILNPNTGEPLDLADADVKAGKVTCPKTGRTLILAEVPGGILHGICPPAKTSPAGPTDFELLRDGEIGMVMLQNNFAGMLGRELGRYAFALPPALEPGGKPAVVAIPLLYGLNADLRGGKLDASWRYLAFFCGPDWTRIVSRHLLDHGYPQDVSPLDAERFGFQDGLEAMPESWVRVNREAWQAARVIPFFSGYQQAETEFFARTVNKIVDSPEIDIPAALKGVQQDVDGRILRPPGSEAGPGKRIFATVVLALSLGAIGWGIVTVTTSSKKLVNAGAMARPAEKPRIKIIFWVLVLPALASVLLWSYYPVFRGFLLAFQEYRFDDHTRWVGLANFIEGAGSPRFWYTIWNSVKFVALNLALGFFAPILLAVLLNEIPKGKYLFRTVYFLPAVTSSLVIMLLWTILYDPSPDGMFNQLLHPFVTLWNEISSDALDIEWPIRWLQNPKLAMIAVIVPAVWAGMGTGCLIYLAALQSVSPDFYEAAEIDGAGFWDKLTKITLPYLRPLLIINLVGAFAGSAHGWGNIFIMTGGGPDLSTQVAALEIWTNSFVFLRFGMATAQAWILSAMLIGFTVWQIKQMQKVDFRKAGVR